MLVKEKGSSIRVVVVALVPCGAAATTTVNLKGTRRTTQKATANN
jgi:hypothetical protein